MGRLFGTDGIRGVANEKLTCELALEIGRATAMALSNHARRRLLVAIGTDTRISSDMLSHAIAAGLCSMGADVLMLGVIPTPAVAYLVGRYKADAGVMISASHNVAGYNGIKIFTGDGYKLADELEERIESLVLDKEEPMRLAKGEEIGKISYKDSAVKDYVQHLKSTVTHSLDGMRIAVDCANGAASKTAGKLFTELGADCALLFDKPDGLNINQNCGSTHMDALRQYVLENHMDAGVAFDGDADRCLCVDGDGNLVDGDMIMAICALDMKKRGKLNRDTVVGTVMTNLGFIRFCEQNGIRFTATKVGDRYVLEKMLQEEYDFGGEQSGHIIFRDFATLGDGQLTAVQLLSLLKREGKTLAEMTRVMTRYPQVMINVTVPAEGKLAFYTDQDVREAVDEGKRRLGKEGRVVVRVSGTEPLIRVMCEGADMNEIQSVAKDIADTVKKRLGSE